ncbi:hypothetical protein PIB30_065501 [Stylosanthes scabra]|uniref:Uncharacterized protein n=1 Tax=Stylosanthes scabra TaxID=79078 RepID=A0ABU6VKH7_9FABA|nr:hypothetical protein [Stylosanthes scabra]
MVARSPLSGLTPDHSDTCLKSQRKNVSYSDSSPTPHTTNHQTKSNTTTAIFTYHIVKTVQPHEGNACTWRLERCSSTEHVTWIQELLLTRAISATSGRGR